MSSICFEFVIFSSRCTINLCQNKSCFTFWKKNFNKVSDKLLGQLLVLPAAKLKSACTKIVFVPRSLSLTLLKFFFQNVKLDLFRHRLMVRGEENMTTKKNG
jgi:hypothetical protein